MQKNKKPPLKLYEVTLESASGYAWKEDLEEEFKENQEVLDIMKKISGPVVRFSNTKRMIRVVARDSITAYSEAVKKFLHAIPTDEFKFSKYYIPEADGLAKSRSELISRSDIKEVCWYSDIHFAEGVKKAESNTKTI